MFNAVFCFPNFYFKDTGSYLFVKAKPHKPLLFENYLEMSLKYTVYVIKIYSIYKGTLYI